MPYREFKFHRGGGSLEYDQDGVKGVVYGDERNGSTFKDVSNSIMDLIKRGEWCAKCDLELPGPISDPTIEAQVLATVSGGAMNLHPLPWDVISGRLRDQRCPACGAYMTEKMIEREIV